MLDTRSRTAYARFHNQGFYIIRRAMRGAEVLHQDSDVCCFNRAVLDGIAVGLRGGEENYCADMMRGFTCG